MQNLGQLFYAQENNISINNSKFIYNRAFSEGGVLDVDSCTVHIAVTV